MLILAQLASQLTALKPPMILRLLVATMHPWPWVTLLPEMYAIGHRESRAIGPISYQRTANDPDVTSLYIISAKLRGNQNMGAQTQFRGIVASIIHKKRSLHPLMNLQLQSLNRC